MSNVLTLSCDSEFLRNHCQHGVLGVSVSEMRGNSMLEECYVTKCTNERPSTYNLCHISIVLCGGHQTSLGLHSHYCHKHLS